MVEPTMRTLMDRMRAASPAGDADGRIAEKHTYWKQQSQGPAH